MSSQAKSIIIFLLIMAMTFSALAGCTKKEPIQAGTISDFESQAHFQPGTSEDESMSGETSKVPVSGEFVVSDKKYNYNGANLELLHVENQTNRNYNVTIHGTYLDESGETIKEETQTFEAFPAGWSNYFIFYPYPRTTFEDFIYTIDMEECTGDSMAFDADGIPLASFIEFAYEKNLRWQRGLQPINDEHPDDAKEVRDLVFDAWMTNSHSNIHIMAECHVLIMDSEGEIFATDYDVVDYGEALGSIGFDGPPVGAVEDDIDNRKPTRRQDVGRDETVPSDFTAIIVVTRVYDWDRWVSSIF